MTPQQQAQRIDLWRKEQLLRDEIKRRMMQDQSLQDFPRRGSLNGKALASNPSEPRERRARSNRVLSAIINGIVQCFRHAHPRNVRS